MHKMENDALALQRPSLTLASVTFSDGQTIHFEDDEIIVLVGPNNAGKSASLRELRNRIWLVPEGELEGFCRSIQAGHGPSFVEEVLKNRDLETDPELQEARAFIKRIWEKSPISGLDQAEAIQS